MKRSGSISPSYGRTCPLCSRRVTNHPRLSPIKNCWPQRWRRHSGVTAEIAVETILRILGDPIDVRKMESAFEAVHPLMLSTWREQDQDRAEQIIRQAYQEGAGVVGNPNMLEDLPRYDQYAANQASNTAFCSNNFWQFGLVPAISAAFEKTVTDNTEGEVDDNIRKWAELIGPIVLREIPFWPLVSSGVASRAYHWALTKAGTIGGFRGYTVRANGDEATSEICQIMHGREYWLADAERTYDQVVNAQDEQARDIQVYVTPEQARSFQRQTGRGSEGLAPPFHFSCRTTIRLLPY